MRMAEEIDTSSSSYKMAMWTERDPYQDNLSYFLWEIDAAIHAILAGAQSYTIGSRKLVRADLSQLYKMRQEILSEINAKKSSGFFDDCYVAEWPGER